ncbi:polyhydroxyalkanoate depolymerase [Alphaproteobacteria bacterium]|jgi:poly(3-hydroxybutyrate) depolymerase|nr:polyhydroxyalkanoate depolymerase [Alphaproteobacteria bacterium]MDC6453019.1 polyhydroxyalkanoate depolymerase [Alphaproteobacteria bacterium]
MLSPSQSYDLFEINKNYYQWFASTTKTFWTNPIFGLLPSPIPSAFAAWGRVTEHSLSRISVKPDWNISSYISGDSEYHVNEKIILNFPFCNLIKFESTNPKPEKQKVLIIAPMSGHYATLVRKTVISLLPDCEVYVTDWKNARDIPFSKGKFDIEDFTKYLIEFFKELSPKLHILAVCQPAPLALAATAFLAKEKKYLPSSLTLIGGPIDPNANPTSVTDFGNKIQMDKLKNLMTMSVGVNYKGVGRMVYPGIIQIMSFLSMNLTSHQKAFNEQIINEINGEASEFDRHNTFYDEYLAVMDMTAEFYLSTVDRIFKKREIAQNQFTLDGHILDLNNIKNVPTFVIEGKNDDISAPGQCLAALHILKNLPEKLKFNYLHHNAGHYGIFSGKAWRKDIRPQFIDFINKF